MSRKGSIETDFMKAVKAVRAQKKEAPKSRVQFKEHDRMTQGITVKYIGVTDKHGRRMKATGAAGTSITIPYDNELDDQENAVKAAAALAAKLKWKGNWKIGSGPGTIIFVSGETAFTVK